MSRTGGSGSRCIDVVAAVLRLLVAAPVALGAQASIVAEVGTAGFAGGAADTSAGGGAFRPYHLTTLGVRLQHRWRRVGWAVGALTSRADVAVDGSDVLVALKHQLRLLEIGAEASVLIARPGPAASLWALAGPLLDRWSPEGGERRQRVGGQVGATLEWSLGGRFSGSLRGAVALTRSAFEDAELPAGYERRAMWRRSLAGGVCLRL